MGCDERRAVHCGNPGAAATGSSSLGSGAGRRGRARGARAGSEEAGRRASEERGEKRRERPREHRPDTLLLLLPPPLPSRPVSAARAPLPRAASPPPGSGCRALPAEGAWERPGLAGTWRRTADSGCWAHRGPRRGLERARRPPRPCPGRAGSSLVLFKKQTRKPTCLRTAFSCPCLGAFVGRRQPRLLPRRPFLQRAGWTPGRGRRRGGSRSAWAWAPGSCCARSCTW